MCTRTYLLIAAALLALAAPAAASPATGVGDEPAPSRLDPSDPNVVGGRPAPLGKWNDTAAVLFGGNAACTGTLIAPDLVLTAGHCMDRSLNAVKLGTNDWASSEGETIQVTDAIEYPNSQSTYDVALLVLAGESSYQPRVLATGCVLENSLKPGAPVAIAGYGAINQDGNQYTTMLMEAETTITDPDCTTSDSCQDSVSPGGELGAGGEGIDSCFGDSGGPLYLLDDHAAYLVGVTSRGYSIGGSECGQGGIYVRPDAVIDWIESSSGRTLPRATCNVPPEAWIEGGQPGQGAHFTVEAGRVFSIPLSVRDESAGDTHTLSNGMTPTVGQLATDGLTVHYRAPEDYLGPDSFTVIVSDSGVPSMSAEIGFTVEVVPPEEGGCGCQTSSGRQGATTILLLFLAALVPLARRHRRR
jgi:hypothetical protein